MKVKRATAFSLVELVVVSGLIGMVASLSFPMVSQLRTAAQSTKCISNLRQIGLACLSYAGENDNALPPGPTWDRAISPYIGVSDWTAPNAKSGVLQCPVDSRKGMLPSGRHPRSYSGNAIKTMDPSQGVLGDGTNFESRRLNTCATPSQTILMYENFTDNAGRPIANEQFSGAFAWALGFQDKGSIPKLAKSHYHGTRMNALFVDGRVAGLAPEIIYAQPNILWRAVPK